MFYLDHYEFGSLPPILPGRTAFRCAPQAAGWRTAKRCASLYRRALLAPSAWAGFRAESRAQARP